MSQDRVTMEISREYRFEACHWLPYVPDGHKCKKMHGHSYRITVAVRGVVDPLTGFVIDYADIDAVVAPIIAQLDHQCVNDFVTNSTAENIAIWLHGEIRNRIDVSEIEVFETHRARASLRIRPCM